MKGTSQIRPALGRVMLRVVLKRFARISNQLEGAGTASHEDKCMVFRSIRGCLVYAFIFQWPVNEHRVIEVEDGISLRL